MTSTFVTRSESCRPSALSGAFPPLKCLRDSESRVGGLNHMKFLLGGRKNPQRVSLICKDCKVSPRNFQNFRGGAFFATAFAAWSPLSTRFSTGPVFSTLPLCSTFSLNRPKCLPSISSARTRSWSLISSPSRPTLAPA